MSVAEVERSGPFSRYEGVQRWFAVLSGAGVRLSLDGQTHDLTRDSGPVAFDGAATTACELINGPTQDFNLMVRGGRSARMRRLAGDYRFVLKCRGTAAVYAIDAEATLQVDGESIVLPAQSLAWRTLPVGTVVRVIAADALWMEVAL